MPIARNVDATKQLKKVMLTVPCDQKAAIKLIQSGANPNVRDADGNTLLHILIDTKSKIEDIEELVTLFGANINLRNSTKHTPLERLISSIMKDNEINPALFDIETITNLIKLGARPLLEINQKKITILTIVSQHEEIGSAKEKIILYETIQNYFKESLNKDIEKNMALFYQAVMKGKYREDQLEAFGKKENFKKNLLCYIDTFNPSEKLVILESLLFDIAEHRYDITKVEEPLNKIFLAKRSFTAVNYQSPTIKQMVKMFESSKPIKKDIELISIGGRGTMFSHIKASAPQVTPFDKLNTQTSFALSSSRK